MKKALQSRPKPCFAGLVNPKTEPSSGKLTDIARQPYAVIEMRGIADDKVGLHALVDAVIAAVLDGAEAVTAGVLVNGAVGGHGGLDDAGAAAGLAAQECDQAGLLEGGGNEVAAGEAELADEAVDLEAGEVQGVGGGDAAVEVYIRRCTGPRTWG